MMLIRSCSQTLRDERYHRDPVIQLLDFREKKMEAREGEATAPVAHI